MSTPEERIIREEIEDRAVTDPQWAIAWAQVQLADAQDRTATWIKNLGNADAATPMGGLEGLGAVFKELGEGMITAVGEVGEALQGIEGSIDHMVATLGGKGT